MEEENEGSSAGGELPNMQGEGRGKPLWQGADASRNWEH